MASFEVTCDAKTGVVYCRFSGFVPDAEVDALVEEMMRAVHAARRRYRRVRMLVDNRHGTVLSTYATAAVAGLKSVYTRGDRIAALVPSGLRKLQAERNVSEQTRVFLSEAEAMRWLEARHEEPIG